MRTTINEFEEEYARLSLQAERLHDLLTSKIGEEWSGDAFDACRRESRDNGELMADLLNQLKKVQELCGPGSDQRSELPTDILI